MGDKKKYKAVLGDLIKESEVLQIVKKAKTIFDNKKKTKKKTKTKETKK